MALIIHDLRCKNCQRIEEGVAVKAGEYPDCGVCGGERTWVPRSFVLDLFGTPQYSDASGEFHSSQREKERFMAKHEFYGAGDKEHGGRKELTMNRSAFSYRGQGSRVSTAER